MLTRFLSPKGLVFTVDLSKIVDRENPRTVEAPIYGGIQEPVIIEWGDGTSDTVTTGSFPTHTYADGTGNVFVVTLRSVTGHLPDLTLSQNDQYNSTSPNANVTLAVVSVDHFAGQEGSTTGNPSCSQYKARFTSNLKYCDPRFVSQTKWTTLSLAFRSADIEQKLNSFCFDFCSQLRGAEAVFMGCTSLTGSIPEGLFDNNTLVTTFAGVFSGCSGLTGSIPEGLFDYNTSVTTFTNTFNGCSGLTGSIPAGLFDTNVEAGSFSNTFTGCTGLTGSIPTGLFKNNIKAATFRSCFSYSGISGNIPSDMFGAITVTVDMMNLFYNCRNLSGSIPDGLFASVSSISSLYSAFQYCTGLTGDAPEYWDAEQYPNIIQPSARNYCFAGDTQLDNYADIPAGWK